MRKRWYAAAGMLGLVLATGWAHGGDIISSFPDKLLFVAKFNVAKVKQVPPVKEALGDQISKVATVIGQIRSWTGIDLESVATLWIGVEKKDNVIIVLEGPFNVQGIRSAMVAIPTVQILSESDALFAVKLPDDKRPGEFNMGALLTSDTVVFGRPHLVEPFIDTYTVETGAAGTEAQSQLAVLRESESMLHAVIRSLNPEDVKKQPFLSYLERGELKGDMEEDLLLGLAVGVTKPEMLQPLAKALGGGFAFWQQMDKPDPGTNPKELLKRRLLDNVTVNVVDDRVVLTSRIEAGLLQELIAGKI
jgi:hypothetical protein